VRLDPAVRHRVFPLAEEQVDAVNISGHDSIVIRFPGRRDAGEPSARKFSTRTSQSSCALNPSSQASIVWMF
jgi:hypothetical protein